MCVGSVCTHPSYNDKTPPSVFFLIPFFKSSFSNKAVLRPLSEWRSSVQAPPTRVDWQDHLTLDPPWVNCHHTPIVQGKTRMPPIKRLRRFVVGCNNEYSSCHLLLTSEPLKTQRINITFTLKWRRRSPICLNASMFKRMIRDPASSTEELSITFFMNLCTSPFLIMC